MIKLKFFKQFGITTMLLYLFLTILRVNNNVIRAYIGSEIFNFIDNKSFNGISTYLTVCILGQLSVSLGKFFHARMTNKLNYSYISSLREKIYDSISNNTDISNQEKSHQYLSVFSSDLELLEKKYTSPKFEIILEVCQFSVSVIISCLYDLTLTFVVALISFSALFVPKIFQSSTENLGNILTDSQKKYIKTVNDFLTGISTIKIFKMNSIMRNKYINSGRELDNAHTNMNNKLDDAFAVNNIIGSISYILISIAGAYFIINKDLKIGSFMAIVQLSNTLTLPVESISGYLNDINSTSFIRKKINTILSVPNKNDIIQTINTDTELAFTIDKINYKTNDTKIFNNFSTKIFNKSKVLITGESGSGKSTLVNLLIGNITGFSGEIKLFNINIRSLNLSTIYENISIIEQNPFIFNDTILFNITLGREYSNCEIEQAITFSCLEKVIAEKGMEYVVGENGNLLSGGQKQRLNIARAFLANKPIIIFDEATSSLDKNTSNQIEQNILSLNKTIIFVAHNSQNSNLFSDIIHLDSKKNKQEL